MVILAQNVGAFQINPEELNGGFLEHGSKAFD
jgi:hypothetical protein